MKTIYFLILFLILSCGTDQGTGKFYNYTIKNESGFDIKINSFRTVFPKRETPVITNLSNNQSINKTFQDVLPPGGYSFVAFFDGDSLVINYDNLKKQIFDHSDNQNPGNPFSHRGTEVTFVFTEEDYENAEPCENDDCD